MTWQDRISSDPAICQGRACVRGTRIPVSVVLDNLADGVGRDEILSSYPTLTDEDVSACIAYAADVVAERIVPLAASN